MDGGAWGDTLGLLVGWSLLVFAAGYVVGKRRRAARDLSGPPPMPRGPSAPPAGLTSEAEARIDEALRQGRKIEAIRHLREATGMGLKDAKDAIDARER